MSAPRMLASPTTDRYPTIYRYSTVLFATPTWMEGVGRLLDFGDTLTTYNVAATPEQTDAIAMWADWAAVGQDIRNACTASLTSGWLLARMGEKG